MFTAGEFAFGSGTRERLPMKQKITGFLFRIGMSLAFIGGISYLMRDKIGLAITTLQHGVSWTWFYAAIAIYFATQILMTTRFYCLLKVQKVKVTFWNAFDLTLTGLFFNLFMPSAVGGDLAKAYYIA